MPEISPSIEAEAKAALLRFLKSSGKITRASAVVLELSLAKQLNRADVVTVDKALHCYEIKTRRDTLMRLDRQLAAYAAAADRVTVVAATRHINAILSNVPDYVGVLEIVEFNQKLQIRKVRPARASTDWNIRAALDLLPAAEIRTQILKNVKSKRRDDLVKLAENVDAAKIRRAVLKFLHNRYSVSTKRFFDLLGHRSAQARDLNSLRIWKSRPPSNETKSISAANPVERDRALYYTIGESFGPVPDDVRELLKA